MLIIFLRIRLSGIIPKHENSLLRSKSQKIITSSEKDELAIGKKLLNTFIAQPTEARDIEFFNMDQEALETITVIITEFQQTPFLFIKNFGENKED